MKFICSECGRLFRSAAGHTVCQECRHYARLEAFLLAPIVAVLTLFLVWLLLFSGQ